VIVKYWPIVVALLVFGGGLVETRVQAQGNAEDITRMQQQQVQIMDLRERAARAETNTDAIKQEQTEQRAILLEILRETRR